jgi:hypothetical protein
MVSKTKSNNPRPLSQICTQGDKPELENSNHKASALIKRLQPVPCNQDEVSVDAVPSRLSEKHPSMTPTKSADKLTRFRKIEKEMEKERVQQ